MCAGNAVVKTRRRRRPEARKAKSSGRIDGMVATAMAMGVAPLTVEDEGNVFDQMARDGVKPETIDDEAAILRDPAHPRFNEMRDRVNQRLAAADEEEEAF
jgi:hypothetical protein